VIAIGDRQEAYVAEVAEVLTRRGFRIDTHTGSEKLGAKIRQAQLEKIPFMLVCRRQEVEARAVAARTREGQQLPAMPIDECANHLAAGRRGPARRDHPRPGVIAVRERPALCRYVPVTRNSQHRAPTPPPAGVQPAACLPGAEEISETHEHE